VVLCFSIGLALVTGILFGLSPALQLSRSEVSQAMQSSTRKIMGGVSGKRTHTALIAAQIATTLLLLSAAGAAMEGFLHLLHADLGYDPHNTSGVGIPMHNNTYMSWEARAAYFDHLRQGVAAGILLSVAFGRLVAGWADGRSRYSVIILAASLLLVCVSGLASFFPARRASAVDPIEALRHE
jgi:hypothetical protein